MQLQCPQCDAPVEVQSLPDSDLLCPACGHSFPPPTRSAKPADELPTRTFQGRVAELEIPQFFGRYRVVSRLGAGGYGVVYKGYDQELQRDVAIKVPRWHGRPPPEADHYLAEARVVAKLDHPGIVPVYDVGTTEQGFCYVVSRFVEGCDLAGRTREARLSWQEAAAIVARVAEALHHAHKHGLVHRDVKPANIVLDTKGNPYVVDFGVALREQDFASGPSFVGTMAYMSPEQARGEGHRVDARSDVFSLGVVFYELLCGRRPFAAGERAELLRQITQDEPRPPRQLDETIPREIDRICLKAISKRAADRYSTAKDMADDIGSALGALSGTHAVPPIEVGAAPGVAAGSLSPEALLFTPSASELEAITIVPKGLRSFDAEDADFFLALLPGPRDRSGLPESIRFWKTRIEETDPDKTFSVGLLYGPSGCGKSSLVKAGLLPRLGDHVTAVFVEATPNETEARLMRGLSKRFPETAGDRRLPDVLAAVRRGRGLAPGHKVLIVLDQFEQWLHARRGRENTELAQALRHCDGQHVQCVLLIRDDFWMAATRLFRELEVPLVEGQTSAAVDLFDLAHARKVLVQYGRAYGTFPPRAADLAPEQIRFLDLAVAGLASEGKAIPVRLALFAQMVRDKPWTPATLRGMGGMTGLRVMFLEQTFSAPTAPPAHRLHQAAARAVLEALLPEQGADIRGHLRSRRELLEASGYAHRPGDFDDLIHILDGELRLVTPTDPEGFQSDEERSQQGAQAEEYYLLTHDYFVGPLREWLTRKHRETARGRAELRLADLAAFWSAHPRPRYLPSWWEWIRILLWTRRRDWTEPQQRMIRQTTRHYTIRGAIAAASGVALLLCVAVVWQRILASSQREIAGVLVRRLLDAEINAVPDIISELEGYRQQANPRLAAVAEDPVRSAKERLHASLALLPVDPGQLDFLGREVLRAEPDQLATIAGLLQPYREQLAEDLWRAAAAPSVRADERLRAACVLAHFNPDDARWSLIAENTAVTLASEDFLHAMKWMEILRPVKGRLVAPLVAVFRRPATSPTVRTLVAGILADFCQEDAETVAGLIMDADPEAFTLFVPVLKRHVSRAVSRLRRELAEKPPSTWPDEASPPSWAPAAKTSVAAIEDAKGMLSERSAFCQTMPLAAFQALLPSLRDSGYRPTCFRPYASPRGTLVAAIWTRDGRDWHFAFQQPAEGILKEDEACRRRGLLAVDLTIDEANAAAKPRPATFAALWAAPPWVLVDAKMYLEAPENRHQAAWSPLNDAEFVPRTNLLAFSRGEKRYSSLRWKLVAPPEYEDTWQSDRQSYLRQVSKGYCQADVRMAVQAGGDRQYSAVWWNGGGMRSQECHGLGVEEHLSRSKQFAGQGYRPFSISVAWDPAAKGAVAASVWCRPVATETIRDAFARRQANAAAALLQLGESADFWPLLAHGPDPRLRTWLIHFVARLHTDARVLLERLGRESNPSIRRALLLCLAECPEKSFSDRDSRAIRSRLLEVHRQDPDPGVHSAAEFALEKLGIAAPAVAANRPGPTPAEEGARRWHQTRNGHTMVILDGPAEFVMGSPGDEPQRTRYLETQHRRRIPRSFAIATKEVTVAQFLRFRPDHNYAATYSPEANCPVNKVSWYDAARYCRWLSEQEAIPEEEMCYPPVEAIGEGMKLAPGCLERTGYRLPTEAEWEYACRANTATSRYFGHSDELLPHYAWNVDCSNYRTWPVGRLRPNDFGLFDMLGNVMEWCHDRFVDYPRTQGNEVIEDVEDAGAVDNQAARVLRGGAFLYQPSNARAANRDSHPPGAQQPYVGFRVARTWKEPHRGPAGSSKP